MKKFRTVRPLTLVCAVGLLAVAVSAAFAAGGGGSLHASANKHSGVLRLASACKRTEKAVSWNTTGPRGVQGPQGAQGPQGVSGPGELECSGGFRTASTSDAFTEYWEDATVPHMEDQPFNLGSVSVPAGNFMVFGRTSIVNETDAEVGITCGLGTPGITNNGDMTDATDEAHLQDVPVGAEQTITLLGPVDLSDGAGDATLDCFLSGSTASTGNVFFTDIQVSAMQVGALHFP